MRFSLDARIWLQRTRRTIEEIFAMSDDQLFSKINSNSLHILQQFMPDRPRLNYSLRARPHNKTLIAKTAQQPILYLCSLTPPSG